jgi:hypothetical protein
MHASDRPEFVKLLSLCYAAVLRPLPDVDVLELWMVILEPFSIDQVRVALSQHMRESKFPPVPADVVTRMAKRGDGRLEAAEAWAIARKARDESETVCWTHEMAEALAITTDIEHDEFAARTAFAARYNRLVEDARAAGKPPVWFMSYGHDASKRDAAALEAVRAGYMQLEHVRKALPMLAAPEIPDTQKAREQRAELDRLLANIPSHAENLEQQRSAEVARQREFTDEAKRIAAKRVSDYRAGLQ